jgi:isoamylase
MDEFRDMVKTLHRAGIEVILDVVFNHTAEGGHNGPTLCFRGLDNGGYYILEADRSRYANYSGTGNTLNANHSIVRRMILDSLRYWVREMHIDGFRFDLASILARVRPRDAEPAGALGYRIRSHPRRPQTDRRGVGRSRSLSGRQLIGDSWKEWNGRFRDDVRSFLRGEENTVGRFADRFIGSPEIYGHKEREAEQSVNFVTCHDGFTLNDLVSYNEKHNEANGEANRDGANDNRSWNCGAEGPTDDPAVEKLRNRQTKNFLTIAMLSLGVPMILMGDEARHSQHGNNNAYCQDNETSWFDWTLIAKHAQLHRFVKLLIARRLLRDVEHEGERVSLNQLIRRAGKGWHGVKLGQPDWSDHSHSIAFTAEIRRMGLTFHLIANSYWEALDFELPNLPDSSGDGWRRWIDTSLDSPGDILEWQNAPLISDCPYRCGPRSVVVLFANIA